MKRYFALLMLLLAAFVTQAQTVNFTGDTARFYKRNGDMTIRLENATRAIKGIIANVDGKGTMQFIKSKILGDTAFVVGLDTLKFPAAATGGNDQVLNIASLKNYVAKRPQQIVTVTGYYNYGDGGGGQFFWSDTSTMSDNGGTVIKVINVATGRWKRIITADEINVRWFGAKGDGTDDTEPVRRLFDYYKGAGPAGGGARIFFPEGQWMLDSIHVWPGTDIVSKQLARDNYVSYVRSRIFPKPGAKYVFYYDDAAKNCLMQGVYIDGNWETNPNLIAGVRWAGSFNVIEMSNIVRCAQTAILSSCGGFVLQDNNIQGWYGAPPASYADINDFRGALQITLAGDMYILRNEISAALPYFTKHGMDMVRDTVNGRIAVMAVTGGFLGNSWVEGNFFENGDRAVVLAGGQYAVFSHNRYELSGRGGLLIKGASTGGGNYFYTFMAERFSDNSLGRDGGFPDIEMTPGAIGFCNFISPIFERIASPVIPETYNKVNYNIMNNASPEITVIAPLYDTGYLKHTFVNMDSAQSLPVKQALIEYDVDRPRFKEISTAPEVADTHHLGYVLLGQGTDTLSGGYAGSVRWVDGWGHDHASLGFTPGNDMWMQSFKNSSNFAFINYSLAAYQKGDQNFSLVSSDSNNVTITMQSGMPQKSVANFTLNKTTGDMRIGAGNKVIIGNAGNGGISVEPSTGYTGLPTIPAASTPANGGLLMRDRSTGLITMVPRGQGVLYADTTSAITAATQVLTGANRFDIGTGTAAAFGGNLQIGPNIAELSLTNTATALVRLMTWYNGVTGGIKALDFFGKGITYEADYSAVGLTDPRWLPDLAAVQKVVHDSLPSAYGALPSSTGNKVIATPDGTSGQATLRALVANDIPSLDAAKITTGTIPMARLVSSGTPSSATLLRGDGIASAALVGPFTTQGLLSGSTTTGPQIGGSYNGSQYWRANTLSTGTTQFTATGTTPVFQMMSLTTMSGGVAWALTTATDANYTIPLGTGIVVLPVITANRTVTLPTLTTGQFIIIHNRNNAAFTWSFTNANVKDATGATITNLTNQVVYQFYYDGTNLYKMN